MPGLQKAHLIELEANQSGGFDVKSGGKDVPVQFNPESLRVSYSNQVRWPGSGDQRGTAAIQFVGTGTTRLSTTVWFDASANASPGDSLDVRKLTAQVAYFIEPAPGTGNAQSSTTIRPVRFEWGTFRFDGVMESMDETLEFFASDGTPIRASVAFNLSRNRIQFLKSAQQGTTAGSSPLTPAPQGGSVQQMAAGQGTQDDWQSIAAANGIENPRQLAPGQLLDMSAGASVGGGIGASAGAGIGFSAGASAGVSAGAGVSVGGGLSAGFGGGVSGAISGGAVAGASASASASARVRIGLSG